MEARTRQPLPVARYALVRGMDEGSQGLRPRHGVLSCAAACRPEAPAETKGRDRAPRGVNYGPSSRRFLDAFA